MSILKPENFSWIQEEELPYFFDSCLEEVISVNPKFLLRERFPSCPSDVLKLLDDDISRIIKNTALGNITKNEFEQCVSWMKPETQVTIYGLILKNVNVVRKRILMEELKQVHHLTDFDYNVKLCISSSKRMDLNQPLVSLFLHTKTSTGQTKVLHLEMTAEEVHFLISLLQDAKRKIDDISLLNVITVT